MEGKRQVYFDNAATSWPKPPEVAAAVSSFISDVGANPGRSAHSLSIEASGVLYDARELAAKFFNLADTQRCIFTLNATTAINLVFKGLLRPGDHVITSGVEHNAVMRPLRALERGGVEVTVLNCAPYGHLDSEAVEHAIKPNTKLVTLNHASNVTGTLLPIREVGRMCRAHGVPFMVDSAQTAGSVRIDMEADNIDLLVFAGHKSLLGPQGVGGVAIGGGVDFSRIEPLVRGGTGSGSEVEEQPNFLPDMFEAGTPNTPGISGLAAGITFVLSVGIEEIRAHELELTRMLLGCLREMPQVEILGDPDPETRVATVSFNLRGISPSEVGFRLDDEFGVLCRTGLHCSPATHKTLGTFPRGAVRFGLGYFSTEDEIDYATESLKKIAGDSN